MNRSSTLILPAGIQITHLATPPQRASAAAARDVRQAEFQATLKRFVEAFGVQCGTRYAADGLTFEQASAKHAGYVAAVRRVGEIWAAEEQEKQRQSQLTPAIGAGAAKFAAALRLPK